MPLVLQINMIWPQANRFIHWGYAFPDQQPLFPQAKAELMAGYIPVSQTTSKMPESLNQTLINEITAIELGWK